MTGATGKTAASAVLALTLAALALAGCGGVRSVDGTPTTPGESTPPSATAPVSPDRNLPPAVAGAPLEQLSQPPAQSLWALSTESYDEGIEVTIEFQPYGIGPSSFGPSIVALVSSATQKDSAGRVPSLVGRNVVFIVGQTAVESGGRYTGTAVTRRQDDRIVFVLQQVSPATGQ